MSNETRKAIDRLLETVDSGRRAALKRLLAGAGVLALLPSSTVLVDAAQEGRGRGKKDGEGKKGDGSKKDLGKKDLGRRGGGEGKKGDGEAKKGRRGGRG